MQRLATQREQLLRRKSRIRKIVIGTNERPRLTLFISNKHVSAQIINDREMKTLISASTYGTKKSSVNIETATKVGASIAEKAKKAKIKHVTFDRNGRKYHGQVKAFANAARENGLEF